MRSWNTTAHPDWIEPETERILICDSCYNPLNEFEQDDPIEIDGRIFCDRCAGDYITFRCGSIRKVSAITHELLLSNMTGVNLPEFAHEYFNYKP